MDTGKDRIHDDTHGCRNSGMPLGGIGAGSLEIRPDGHFHRWMLMNNRPWGTAPENREMEPNGLRFGLRFDAGGGPVGLALEKHLGLDPGPDGWFWDSDPYHVPWVAHAESIGYRARFPRAELDYRFPEVPLAISLKAWSPFLPGRAGDSNTPGAFLEFAVRNTGDTPCRVALFGLLKNAVGYDRWERPATARALAGDFPGLVLGRAGLPPGHGTDGSLALFADCDRPFRASFALHPQNGRFLWDPLLAEGRLEDKDYGQSAQGTTMGDVGAERAADGPQGMARSALCLDTLLPPGGGATFRFHLAWHFPHFYERDHHNGKGGEIGVRYATRFDDAEAVARWMREERPRLEAGVDRFQGALGRTSLPAWMVDAASSTLGVLFRSAWWDRQGRFGVWEGVGSCGLQTIDVAHYASLAILQFFPELDLSMNRLSVANALPDGRVPHLMPGNFSCNDAHPGGRERVDLGPQFILAIWRHVKWTGNLQVARGMWGAMEVNLAAVEASDRNGDGLPDNEGPDQTYDAFPLFGTSAYVGGLYLAALRALAEVARWLGKAARARELEGRFEAALATYTRQLWNGHYFNLSHQARDGAGNAGCMADQVNGDWYFRQASGLPLLPDDKVREALVSVLRLNRRGGAGQAWLANCVWPGGGEVRLPMNRSDQANCPWSGVEYAVAAHMALMGLREEARRVAADVFRRYEAAGMRFDHIECGEYYYRSMSGWALYQAEFGVAYDAVSGTLRLGLQRGRDASFVLPIPGCLAEARWDGQAGRLYLEVLEGESPAAEVLAPAGRGRLAGGAGAGGTVAVELHP